MRGRRPRTISVSFGSSAHERGRGDGRDRAQTTQDFAVGIGIFLLAVAFVFSYVPSLITPYTAATTAETAQADRITDEIVNETDLGHNHLDFSDFAEEEDLEEYGLRTAGDDDEIRVDRVNISIVDVEDNENGEELTWSLGDEYDDEAAGTATRVVTIEDPGDFEPEHETENDEPDCDDGCLLIVRVW